MGFTGYSRIGYYAVSTVLPSKGVSAEANCTIRKALSVHLPVWVTTPTVIDWIPGSTGQIGKLSSRIIDTSAAHTIPIHKISKTLIKNTLYFRYSIVINW